ncbi:hypothetical protein AMR72_09140 [Flavobacterium psychrophilum]|nr:hypothetical protein AMR72_09140 [Flavobacterium psychrophilum]AOE52655.1 hypothetical protein ALW18_09130 [Flavobacterium psychrophilum]
MPRAMVKKLHIPLLFVVAFSFAQNEGYDFKAAENLAGRLVYNTPEKALQIIKKTLAQKDAHDTIYGASYNLYGTYYGVKGKPDSTIYYVKKSLKYLDGYPKLKVKSLMNLALGYRNKGDYNKSINLLEDAVAIHQKLKNNTGLATAYSELANNYSYMTDYKTSVDFLVKAINLLKTDKNNKQLPAIKQKLANTYLAQHNYEFAIDLYRDCLKDFKAADTDQNYYLTLVNLGNALSRAKKYTEARRILNEAANGLQTFNNSELKGLSAFRMGELEEMQGQNAKAGNLYSNAIENLNKTKSVHLIGMGGSYIRYLNDKKDHENALKIISIVEASKKFRYATREDQLTYQNAIADTYKATNNDKAAINAYQNTITIMDSIAKVQKDASIQEIQAKFQTELQREKNIALEANNMALQKEMETEKMLMLLYAFISLSIIVLILLFLRGYWLRNRLQNEELKSIETEKNLIQQQHQHEQELTNAQKEIIEEKQRELTSTALRMANYQDSISEIINKCANNADIKIADVKKDLQHLMKQKDYWKQFETRFNNLHPEFGANLSNRFAKLTKNDIEFCSLLKLNMSNKEIASLLQISHESAITKKYRIKKKMEINDDAEFEKLLTEI